MRETIFPCSERRKKLLNMIYLHKFDDIVTNDLIFTEDMKGLCSYKSTARMKKKIVKINMDFLAI